MVLTHQQMNLVAAHEQQLCYPGSDFSAVLIFPLLVPFLVQMNLCPLGKDAEPCVTVRCARRIFFPQNEKKRKTPIEMY